MRDTGYYPDDRHLEGKATGYVRAHIDADYIHMSVAYSAGGLYSTIEDLYRWDQALYKGELISPRLLRRMVTIQARPRGVPKGLGYGYGWAIDEQGREHCGHRFVGHGGAIEGFRSFFGRYPDDKVTIIVLSNWESWPMEEVYRRLEQLVFLGH